MINSAFLLLLLCQGLLLLFAIYLIWSWISKTPFYPSSVRKFQKTLKDFDIQLPKKARFIDLGSGDGRMLIWAANNDFYAEGIEFNPFLSLYSRFNLLLRGKAFKTKILNKNFLNHNYNNYDIVYMYIFPEYMDKLKNKLFGELPKGSIIISNTFKFSNVNTFKKIDRFYIYTV